MKIAIIAHSAVHPRQQKFYKSIAKQGHDVLVVGPRTWNNLTLKDMLGNFDGNKYYQFGKACSNPGSLYSFKLLGIDTDIKEFAPDLIYCQQEWWSDQAWYAFCLAKKYNYKFALFCWENIVYGDPQKEEMIKWDRVKTLLKESDLIVCGNTQAQSIIKPFASNTMLLPQVGIDEILFSPKFDWSYEDSAEKELDLIYVGRNVQQKGVYLLQQAANTLSLKFKIITGTEYDDLPKIYNSAKIFASVPFETPTWKEQSCGYTNLEAMSCGLPVISSDTGAVSEYLQGQAMLIEEGSLEQLIKYLSNLMDSKKLRYEQGKKGRELILNNYSNKVIASKLMERLNDIHR